MFKFPEFIDPFLKDPIRQEELEKNGFTIIPNFLDKKDISELTAFYTSNFIKDSQGFSPSIHYMNKGERQASNEIISNTISQKLDSHFFDYKLYSSNFIVKSYGKESEKDLHQDMTLLDESKYMGINLWIPLCDINENNGALYILPGSHRIVPTFRANTIDPIFYKYQNFILKYLKPIYVNAGDLIAFDHSTLHYSPPNLTQQLRIASTSLLSHKNSKITTCYLDKSKKENSIEIFEHTDNFFEEYTQFEDGKYERPRIGKSIGFTNYTPINITPRLLIKKYGKSKNLSLLEKLKYLLISK